MANDRVTYCVRMTSNRNGSELIIARDIETMAEAAEIALRLYRLQFEIGGVDTFYAAVD